MATALKAPTDTIFVGNLDGRVTEDLVYELGIQVRPPARGALAAAPAARARCAAFAPILPRAPRCCSRVRTPPAPLLFQTVLPPCTPSSLLRPCPPIAPPSQAGPVASVKIVAGMP